VWCERCKRRLILMPGKSRNGQVYFYFICRGRQIGVCDLPYLHISKVERVVENHYATVQLAEDFCASLRARLEVTRSGATATTGRLREQFAKQLAKLNAQEDRYLDLVGDPDWPKEKLSAKMRSIREERARVHERLDQADSPIDGGYEVLEMTLRLLGNPLAMYQAAKQRTRKVINKAIFTKLYVDADPEGAYIAADELNEPFETVLYARRESGFSEALERQEGVRLTTDTPDDLTRVDLLATLLGAPCSSKTALVGTAGFEPATPRL
jgi:site-specific DNA recombinase